MLVHIIISVISIVIGIFSLTKEEKNSLFNVPSTEGVIGLFFICFGLFYFVISLLIYLL